MNSLKFFFTFFLLAASLSAPLAESAVIVQTKGKKALISLKGKKTRKGAYFQVINMYGDPKGLVQITRTGRSKAIGVLKLGKIKKSWHLEPRSKRWAKKAQRTAWLKKRKGYRKMLAAKRKKQRLNRRLANIEQQMEYSADIDDNSFEEDNNYLPEDDSSSYTGNNRESNQKNERPSEENKWEKLPYKHNNNDRSSRNLLSTAKFTLGIMGAGGLNTMTLKPTRNNTQLSGFGWEALGFAEMDFQNGFAFSGLLGYKNFRIANQKSLECGSRNPCLLKIQYVKIGGDLKYIFSRNKSFDLWGGISGSFLWPIAEPINNAGLTKNSFGLHGTLGPVLGVNLKTQNLIIPISFRASFFNPPTDTTFAWALFLRAGIGLQL